MKFYFLFKKLAEAQLQQSKENYKYSDVFIKPGADFNFLRILYT